jgi:DNA-binding CsgD family transcriptional regulator
MIPQETQSQALSLYREGLEYVEIAARLKIGTTSVRRIVRRAGDALRRHPWTDERREAVVALYKSGLSQEQIAEKLGTSQSRVFEALKLCGVETRRGTWQKPTAWTGERDREVARLYLEHWTQKQIARRFGTNQSRVRESLKRSGTDSRPRPPFPTGAAHHKWKGGRTLDKSGYVLVRAPWHPFANRHGDVREHRLVMETILGRFLDPKEVVHHRNSVRDDNRPDNLLLFASNGDHLAIELAGRCPRWTEDGLRSLAEAAGKRRGRKGIPRSPLGTGARRLRQSALARLSPETLDSLDHGPVAKLPPLPPTHRARVKARERDGLLCTDPAP